MSEQQHHLLLLLGLLFLFGPLGALSQLVKAEPNVTILETSPIYADRGSILTLSCKLDVGLEIILSRAIEWVKESRVRGLTNESMVLTRQQTIVIDADNGEDVRRYDVSFNPTVDSVVVVLQITNVVDSDDGRFVCRVATHQESTVVASAEIDVIVPNWVERVALKLDGVVPNATVKVAPGSHSVQCHTEGGNPKGEAVSVFVGDRKVISTRTTSSLMKKASISAGAPRYREQVEANITIIQADNGKKLTCVALAAGMDITTTLNVVPQPSVYCDDVRVRKNDMHVRLVCLVTHVDVMVLDYAWELNDSGIVYSTEGPSNDKIMVTEKVSDTKTRASMRLDVVRWGDTRTLFKMTAFTEVGEVSEDAYIIVVSDDDKDPDDGDDDSDEDNGDGEKEGDGKGDSDGTNGTSPSRSTVLWDQLLLLLLLAMLMVVFPQH